MRRIRPCVLGVGIKYVEYLDKLRINHISEKKIPNIVGLNF